jgi:hypothetical protein
MLRKLEHSLVGIVGELAHSLVDIAAVELAFDVAVGRIAVAVAVGRIAVVVGIVVALASALAFAVALAYAFVVDIAVALAVDTVALDIAVDHRLARNQLGIVSVLMNLLIPLNPF